MGDPTIYNCIERSKSCIKRRPKKGGPSKARKNLESYSLAD